MNFSLTQKDEQDIRRKGKYLAPKGLDDLVAAVRKNFPSVKQETPKSSLYEMFLMATPQSIEGTLWTPPLAHYVQTPVKYFDYYSRYELTETGFKAKVLYDVANGISYFVAYIGTADPDVAIDVCKQIASNIESYSTELKAEYEKQTGQSLTLAYGSFSPPRNFIIYQEAFLQITKKNEVIGIFARGTSLTVDIRGPHDPRPR